MTGDNPLYNNGFVFGGLMQGAYTGDELDTLERQYQQRDFARVQSPSGEINEVVRNSTVHQMLMNRGWIEIKQETTNG